MTRFEQREKETDKESNNIHAAFVDLFYDGIGQGKKYPDEISSIVKSIVDGNIFSPGVLLQEIFRIADFDRFFEMEDSIFS